MRIFLLLGFSACVSAAPRKEEGEQSFKKISYLIKDVSLEDAMVIIRCMAENFGYEKKILSCRNCFKTVGDYMSAGGLLKAQSCAKEFWPESSLVREEVVVGV